MLVDTNILIYAINEDSPKNKKAQEFLRENIGNLEIAHQNVLEAIRVLTHVKYSQPMKLEDALEAVQDASEACEIISPDQSTYYLMLDFIKENKLSGNRIFDGYLAATALSNGVEEIATDNIRDFKKFKGLKVINPFV